MARGPGSCGACAYVLRGMWNLSSPAGIESMSPSLQGGFLTTEPPGKTHFSVLRWKTLWNAKTRLDKMGSKESKSKEV